MRWTNEGNHQEPTTKKTNDYKVLQIKQKKEKNKINK